MRLALAYAFGETNQVKAHSEWAGKKFKPKFKPKTIILLDENGNTLGFGKDAKHTLSIIYLPSFRKKQSDNVWMDRYMATEPMKDKWTLFERFKMALYDDGTIDEYLLYLIIITH